MKGLIRNHFILKVIGRKSPNPDDPALFMGARMMVQRALSFCLSMISAQTPPAFVARENRYPLFRIVL
jgi:hypothetical protein